jgi:hypothetical protein
MNSNNNNAISRLELAKIIRDAERETGIKNKPGLSMCLTYELPLILNRALWQEHSFAKVIDKLQIHEWNPAK